MDNEFKKHQIFKKKIPYDIFISFLESICEINNNNTNQTEYIFNDVCFKREKIEDKNLSIFLEKIKPYYHLSKLNYINKGKTFNGLATILRQICKIYNIKYISEKKYLFSKYTINYHIFI